MICKSGLLALKAFFLKKLKHLPIKLLFFKPVALTVDLKVYFEIQKQKGLLLCLCIHATKILLLLEVLDVSVQGRVTHKRLWNMEGSTLLKKLIYHGSLPQCQDQVNPTVRG